MKIVLGALFVLVFLASALVLGLFISMWAAWWLVPVWSRVLVPLGVPTVDLWHFMSFIILWGAMRRGAPGRWVKDQYVDQSAAWRDWFMGWLINPPFCYYVTGWLMSGR